jgi:hypothetical protein
MSKRREVKTFIGFDGKVKTETVTKTTNINPFNNASLMTTKKELPISFTMFFFKHGVVGRVTEELKESISNKDKDKSLELLESVFKKTKFNKMKKEFSSLFPEETPEGEESEI